MKKIGFLFATVIMMMLFAVSVSALESTGQCGDDVYWSFDESTGELVISGTGEMYNYEYYSHNRPWESFIDDIKTVIVEYGVTTIGEDAFYYCYRSLSSIVLPNTITQIGSCSFYCCRNINNLIIPDSVTSIGSDAFAFCHGLEKIELSANIKKNWRFSVLRL